jgi:predicted dehydrogenase
MASKRIVHIGTGPWGKNYLKTYEAFPISVDIATRDSWQSLIDGRPDGVVICTPPDTHIEIAQFALERGIPVLIEKPLALSLAQAKQLQGYTAPIVVDHLYLFSPTYQAFKRGTLGKRVRGITTVGTGTKNHEGYSVLWDYGPHDVAMVLDLMGRVPERVFANEVVSSAGAAYAVELFFGETTARCHFGVATERVRTVTVECEGTEAVFTDTGAEVPGPLHYAVEVFLGAIDGTPDPRVGLEPALDVVRVLEACERSCLLGTVVEY